MAQRNVMQGRYAEAAIGGVLLALLTDWSLRLRTDTQDITGHGDIWRYTVPVVTGWTFTASGFIVPGFPPQYLKSLWRTGGTIQYFQVRGYDKSVASGTKIFEGTGLPVEGTMVVPMELVTQD